VTVAERSPSASARDRTSRSKVRPFRRCRVAVTRRPSGRQCEELTPAPREGSAPPEETKVKPLARRKCQAAEPRGSAAMP